MGDVRNTKVMLENDDVLEEQHNRRGRLAEEKVKKHGYGGYCSISFTEVENAIDE